MTIQRQMPHTQAEQVVRDDRDLKRLDLALMYQTWTSLLPTRIGKF